MKQERCLLVNPLFHNLLRKLWFDSLRVNVATKCTARGAQDVVLHQNYKGCCREPEMWLVCGFGCACLDSIQHFSGCKPGAAPRRLPFLHISPSFQLKLSNFSFLSCLLFVHLLSDLQIPKSERPAEEWQGKPQEKNHHVPPHTLRNSEKAKNKKKRARQPIRQKNLLVFKTVTSTIYSLAFYFFFQLCFLIPLTGSWLLWMARPLFIFTPSMHWCCQ